MRRAAFAVAFVSSLATVFLSGLLAAALQNWFGVSDLSFLVIFFVPLGVIIAVTSAQLVERARRWSLVVRYLVVLVLGLSLGFVWTFCVVRLLGPWWGAVSLPALVCWMLGGVTGMAGGLVLGPGASARVRIVGALVLVAVAVGAVASSKPLATQLSDDQTLTVLVLKWVPSNEPLMIETEGDEPLSDGVVSLLRLAKITGRVRVVSGGSRHGRGPAATAVILLHSPLNEPVTLRQPDRTMTLYVQNAQGFTTHPANAKTLGRVIALWAEDDGVWYSVHIASGGIQSGPAFKW